MLRVKSDLHNGITALNYRNCVYGRMWNIEIEDGEQLSGMCQAAVMTVITDRVTFVEKLVEYRESWSRCGGWTYERRTRREGEGGGRGSTRSGGNEISRVPRAK